MANLTYDNPNLNGIVPNFVAADVAGDVVPSHPNGYVHVKNDDTIDHTVTVVTPGKSRMGVLDEPDIAVTVTAGTEALIGPMTSDLVDPDLRGVSLTYDAVTSVTIAAIRG